MAEVNPKFKMYPATFNDKGVSDAKNLSEAYLTEQSWLSPIITHMYGSNRDYGSFNFPMLYATEGMNNVELIDSVDNSYKNKVIGRPKKTSRVVKSPFTGTGNAAGKGFGVITLTFEDRWFFKKQSVYSPSGKEGQVIEEPKRVDAGYEYKIKIFASTSQAYFADKDVVVGAKWAAGIMKVSLARSRGGEHRSSTPYATQNQISLVRHSMNFEGNVKNKVMMFEIEAEGKKFKYWTQWEMFQEDLRWKEQCESDLWYSQYNKDENGVINNTDPDTGDPVPSGAGLLEQIDNKDTFSILTERKLKTFIRDIFFNTSAQADNGIAEIDVVTGTGGMEDANDAMTEAAKGLGFYQDTRHVGGSNNGHDLAFGAYFNTYIHQDGHRIVFRKTPMMDRGLRAETSEIHPLTGLPLESHNFYAIDKSTYDGKSNLQYIQEKGRQNVNFMVAGASVPPGSDEPLFRSSDIDASSIEVMKTQGVHIYRPVNCFQLKCAIS